MSVGNLSSSHLRNVKMLPQNRGAAKPPPRNLTPIETPPLASSGEAPLSLADVRMELILSSNQHQDPSNLENRTWQLFKRAGTLPPLPL